MVKHIDICMCICHYLLHVCHYLTIQTPKYQNIINIGKILSLGVSQQTVCELPVLQLIRACSYFHTHYTY